MKPNAAAPLKNNPAPAPARRPLRDVPNGLANDRAPAPARRPLAYVAAAYIAGIAFCYYYAPPRAALVACLLIAITMTATAVSAAIAFRYSAMKQNAVFAPRQPFPSFSPRQPFPPFSPRQPFPPFSPRQFFLPPPSAPAPSPLPSATAPSPPPSSPAPSPLPPATAPSPLPSFIFVSVLAAAFLAGTLYAHASFSRADPLERQMRNGYGYADGVVGRVLLAEQRDTDYRLLTVYADGRKLLVRVYGEKGKPMAPAPEDLVGRRVLLSGALSYPDTARNPGCFDYRLHLLSKNIRVIMTCALPGDFAVLDEAPDFKASPRDIPWRALGLLAKAKAAFTERVGATLPAEEAALMNGMMFGDKEAIDEETYDLFKRNGVAHILSVSGLHVGMVYAFVSVALGRRKTKRFYITVLALLLCYAALSSFSPSVMRAFSMISVHIGAMLLNRRYDMLTGVLLSALAMLLANPLALFGIGFILSYTAACSLSFALPFIDRHTGFMDKLSGRRVRDDKMLEQYGARLSTLLGGYVMKILVMTAAIQFFMLPLTAYFFNCLPLMAVFANIPVIALASIIVPVGLVVLLLASAGAALPSLALALGTAADVSASSAGALIDLMLFFTRLADSIPSGSLTVPSPPLPALLLFYLALYYLLSDAFAMNLAGLRKAMCPQGRRPGAPAMDAAGPRAPLPLRLASRRPANRRPGAPATSPAARRACIFLVPATIALASFLAAMAPASKPPGVIFTFVDVGQGDCLHIRTADGRNYLMDGGGSYGYDVGKNILAPYLLKNGVTSLDGVFVSHLHMDHFKGLAELSGHMGIGAFYVYEGNRVNPHPGPLRYLAAGDTVLLGPLARAEALYPPRREEAEYLWDVLDAEDENRNSLIVRFENEGVSVLMTGDISKDGEQAVLVAAGLGCDILKIAHHGSKSSTSEELLADAKPAAAVIQVGRNTYGHPAEETLETLAGAAIPVYRNDKDGAILIRPHPGGFSVLTVKRDLTSPMLLKEFEKGD